MNTLKIHQLTKIYPNGVTAINDLSLNITNGMFGLLGPNGAGKSTLMRILASLQEPSSGSVHFNGVDIAADPRFLRKHLGYLPQEFGVYPKVKVEELLDHLAILKGVAGKKDRREQIAALLDRTNLYQHRKKALSTFSGGMKQRFGIAQALLGDPQLIIVDEPTAGLDPEERNRFLNLLSEIGENIVVILSTHIVEDVRNLCSNMAIISRGRIIGQGNPEELTATLNGRIWTRTIMKVELEDYQRRFRVISTRLLSGRTQLQVLSEQQPDSGFRSIPPDLESFYFTSLSQNNTLNF